MPRRHDSTPPSQLEHYDEDEQTTVRHGPSQRLPLSPYRDDDEDVTRPFGS